MDLHKIKEQVYVSARDLHRELEINQRFNDWIRKAIRNAMLDDKDFYCRESKSTGGRKPIDYMLTKEAAISVAVVSRSKNAKVIRERIIELYKQHEEGKAFTEDQWLALVDITKAMVLVSIQDEVTREHYELYGNKYTWWKYRAELLGYTTDYLKKAMAKVNRQHKSRRKSLMKLDAHELVRIGAIDLFKALGKSDEYAKNVGANCKKLSKKINVVTDFFDDTKQDKIGIKSREVNERKDLFNKTTKSLNNAKSS
ncbi:MAG: antA/AntB antirepressor family protein [bacterium]